MIESSLKIKPHNRKDQFCSKVDTSIKANGREIKEMEKVCKSGRMDPFIKDTGRIT